jgi:molecular chaperone DnaJ
MSMGRSEDRRDWYDILGVSPTAGDAEIGRAFRRLARRLHPDVTSEEAGASARHFAEVAQAYEVLGDPARRAEYDRERLSGIRLGPSAVRIPVHDRRQEPGRSSGQSPSTTHGTAAPEEPEVWISTAEAATGTTAKVRVEVTTSCPECRGSGRRAPQQCFDCAGQGKVVRYSRGIAINHICGSCGGSGRHQGGRCPRCGGSRTVRAEREQAVRIPSGVTNGSRIRLAGAGADRAEVRFARIRVRPES